MTDEQRGFRLAVAPGEGGRVPAERRGANERGLALPTSLISLAILLSLMVAFSLLAGTEPTIASNQAMSARARAFAESGIERALWALSHPGEAGGIPDPLTGSPAPAPYDGSAASFQAVDVGSGVPQGGFVVQVAAAASGQPNERDLVSVGYVPNADSPLAVKRITTTAMRFKNLAPPCAVCLGGESPNGTQSVLQVGSNARVNGSSATGDAPATYCAGQTPTATILTTGVVDTSGNPDIYAPPGGAAVTEHEPRSTFESFTLLDHEIAVLKTIARSRGTYYQGSQTFTSPPPDGLVFVDTPSGNPLSIDSPAGDTNVVVDIHGSWSSGWRGWLIVAGSVDISGQIDMSGLIYAQNDISIHGSGDGRIRGAVIAQNRVDTVSSQIDSDGVGAGALTYDCEAVRTGGGTIPEHWFVKPGTYREVAES